MRRLLLIEDDASFRTTLAYALRRRGWDVVCAPDSLAALTSVHQGPVPEAILLDMRLGAESGIDLIPKLRCHAPEARLVVLTGYGSIPGALEAVRLGADDYLLKPAGVDLILGALTGRDTHDSPMPGNGLPSLARVEWEHIQRVLHDCGGNISRAAVALGIDRRTLQRKLSKQPPEL